MRWCSKHAPKRRLSTRSSPWRCFPWSLPLGRSGARARAARSRAPSNNPLRMRSACTECSIYRFTSGPVVAFRLFAETRAQASVEAAFLLPVFLTLLLLALQPCCLLYTRAVMESAAAEGARLALTSEAEDEEALEAFVQRRLGAVPNLSIFHEGDDLSWDIAFAHGTQSGGSVSVSVAGAVKPLPILGAFVGAWGAPDESGNVKLKVEVAYNGRPSWLEGSYDSWISSWG